MAERIQVQAVALGQCVVRGDGDSLATAITAFEKAIRRARDVPSPVRVEAVLALEGSGGNTRITGHEENSLGAALSAFEDAASEYSDGPGWGGTG